jgi:uncharacterized protein YbaP (TraB family)
MQMTLGIARLVGTIVLCVLVAPAFAQVDRRYAQTSIGPVEEVLVTGEHPGPGMWKVTRGDHSLWILGTHSPLPQRLIWRSQDVEFAISEAQQVLGNYSASFSMRGGNPLDVKGKSLRRLLSRRSYAQWQSLKRKYIGKNDEIETALPVTVALILRSSAFARAGLVNSDAVLTEVYRMAKAYQVPVTNSHQVTKVIAAMPSGKDAERRGVAFLEATMQHLESDLKAARSRANAWAIGDVGALRAQAIADTTTAQLYASSWPYLDEAELAALTAETDAKWLDAADMALRRNQTTVATLPIFMLLRPNGLLAALRARGFEVIEPAE